MCRVVPTTNIDLSIIVVSYNTRALTEAALTSVLAQTKSVRYEVICVDNASSDGSADMIEFHPINADLIRLSENIGFAQANTLAARRAKGRYILLLNPDTVVLDRAIDKLVDFARTYPTARIWGGRTLFADGRLNPSSCWKRMTPWNLFCRASGLTAILSRFEAFNGESYGRWPRHHVREVDIVSGCFFLIERELWAGLGGFDPIFFMYGEEADLCLRAKAFLAQPLVTPGATIIHHGGASETARADKMVRLLAAKATLINRHWSRAMAPVGRALLAAWPASRAIATTAIASLTGSASAKMASHAWREIWTRRAEWRHGYEAPRMAEGKLPALIRHSPRGRA
ncbi:MAG: glycosyltransferase family 2 protein [Hyphomicrobium sp.]